MLLTYFLLQNSHCFMIWTFFLSCLYPCSLALIQNFCLFSIVFSHFSSFCLHFGQSLFLCFCFSFLSFFLVFAFLNLFFFLVSQLSLSVSLSVSPLPVPPATLLEVKRVPVSSFFQNSQHFFFLGREISFALICRFTHLFSHLFTRAAFLSTAYVS